MNSDVPHFRSIGLEKVTNRQVYLWPLENLGDLPEYFEPAAPRFVLLLLGDFSQSPQVLGEIARRLVEAGCAYFCAWGPGCELMHDEMDQAREKAPQLVGDDLSVLMTTSHADDSIEDAVAFAILRASPVGMYDVGCNATVLAVQNKGSWLQEVEAAARSWLVPHAI